jgi:phosphoglucosamine mutase
MFVQPDGRNINDGCGSQHPEHLAERVVASGADIGLAFDGDGDRLIAVDEGGRVVTGDQMLAVCGKYLKAQGALPGSLVVSTVMSNIGLGLAFSEMGIRHRKTDVGDRYVVQEMRRSGALLGGEDSGHMIFLDRHTTGDGILSALRLLEVIRATGAPLSELNRVMTVYPQMLMNVPVASKPVIETVPAVVAAIAEVEGELGEHGRVLVRYSGTQALCRVMIEGPTREVVERGCRHIVDVIRDELGK